MKLCKMCFKNKPLDQFYDDFGQRDTKMVWCKDCARKYRRERYKKSKDKNASIEMNSQIVK